MKLIFSLLFIMSTCMVVAQGTINETIKQQLIKDWERAKSYTQEYLEAMPADKYSFRPVDSVRTFAEQMLHFTVSNTGMAFIATGYRSPSLPIIASPNFGRSPGSQTKDSVTYYVLTSYDNMINAIKGFDFNKATEDMSWDLPGGKRTTTRLNWLEKAFEHQTHHRGQCTVYLRLVGVKPPNERLWD